MNKVLIIMQRELMTRIRKRSFILLTLLTPFIMIALPSIPLWLASLSSEPEHVAIIDHTGHYAPHFKPNEDFTFERVTPETDRLHLTRDYVATLEITDSLHTHPEASALTSSHEVPVRLSEYINEVLTTQVRQDLLAKHQVEGLQEAIKASQTRHEVRTQRMSDDGTQSDSRTEIAMIIAGLFTIFIYLFIISYGSMMMQSVLEEKTGRIVEVIVSSVKPWQLLWGKLLGIACMGLIQMTVWFVMLGSLTTLLGIAASGALSPTMGQSMADDTMLTGLISGLLTTNFLPLVVCFILYFIGGYFLYASIFAAVGASVNEQEDTQQFMTPVILILVFATYAGMGSIENPYGPLALWCSYIPFTSPIVMMVRLPFGVSMWEVAGSIAILYATMAFIAWAAGQIYRVGILLYGKKPTFMEMLRWITWK
ncbi:MAG: ABC transporter permease [Bacteroidales bacterium]|nr:ABC transporter permease [Bacteroidales bacterium]